MRPVIDAPYICAGLSVEFGCYCASFGVLSCCASFPAHFPVVWGKRGRFRMGTLCRKVDVKLQRSPNDFYPGVALLRRGSDSPRQAVLCAYRTQGNTARGPTNN